MMPGGRPPGPLRSYTVSCVWPADPRQRFRVTVGNVDEKTARESVTALLKMHFPVRVEMFFRAPTRSGEPLGSIVAAQWDRKGCVSGQHKGQFREYIPSWLVDRMPTEEEENRR